MLKSLNNEVVQSKKELREIQKSYSQLQKGKFHTVRNSDYVVENVTMKKYLKVQTNDQLKESQSALQKSQSTVLDLRRQLRKAHKELELLKCGGKIDSGIP